MNQLLLSDKWRPKSLENTILLPRIRKVFENGVNQNYIFYGKFGTGKTSLARILIGKYTKKNPFIEINSSYHTSIDTLRSVIDDFCSKVYMGFDLESDVDMDATKYVYLDEFDRTSIQYQDALKAYIEEYSARNVRFILTTNHIDKISPGIRSRFIEINFDCQILEEELYLKNEIAKKIFNTILPSEGFTIEKEDIKKIVNKKFPDIRAIMIDVDHYKHTGTTNESTTTVNIKLRNDLYKLIYDKSLSYEDIYHFLMEKFGADKIGEMINLFGIDFVNYSLTEKRENIEKLFEVAYIITEHYKLLETNTDPIILGMTVIGKIKSLFQ